MGFTAGSVGGSLWTLISVLPIVLVLVDSAYLLSPDTARSRKTGCYVYTAGSYAINMFSSTACGGTRCPFCYDFDTTFGMIELEITSCDISIHTISFSYGNLMNDFTFSNSGRSLAVIKDGTTVTNNEYIITPMGTRGSRAQCSCTSGKLSCDSSLAAPYTLRAWNSFEGNFNCAIVDTTTSLAISGTSCNNRYCPACFQLDTSVNSPTLTLSDCSYFVGKDYSTSALVTYTFANTGSNIAYISDGTKTFTLAPQDIGTGAFSTCQCYNDLLTCSSLPVRATAAPAPAITYIPSSLSVTDSVMIGHDGTTYAKYANAAIEFYTASTRTLSVGAGVGTLHGTWQADGAVGTSDSRMKKNIRDLRETLRELQQSRLSKEEAAKQGPSVGPAEWVLAQLRPVSFSFIADKKEGRRFGFIAEEIEKVFPELIRVDEADSSRVKRVLMMDFIALLWMALQNHQHLLEQMDRKNEARQQTAEARLSRVEADLARVETDVKQLSVDMAGCRERCV